MNTAKKVFDMCKNKEYVCMSEIKNTILKQIVSANLDSYYEVGKHYAAFDILVNREEWSSINWERNYVNDIYIRAMVCFSFFGFFPLKEDGVIDKELEEEFVEFYKKHKEEVDNSIKEVWRGYRDYIKYVNSKYDMKIEEI